VSLDEWFSISHFEISQTTHPLTQCFIPEDLDPQEHCYENPKSHNIISVQ